MDQIVNTVGEIGYRSQGRLIKKLLKPGNLMLVAAKYGTVAIQPKGSTLTAKWARMESFAVSTAPLSEGVTPPGMKISLTPITVTMQQYGGHADMTDVVFDTHEDNIPSQTVEACTEQWSETVELVTIAALKAGSNVFYSNSAASRAAVDSPPLRGDFRRIYRSLKNSRAKMVTSRIKASTKISTEPIPAAFIAFGHTDLKADLEDMEGWTPAINYANSDMMVDPNEAGTIGEFRVLLTDMFEPWLAAGTAGQTYLSSGAAVSSDTACDVYPIIIVAANSYGVVKLFGTSAIKPAVHFPKAMPGDELGQRGFVSWKLYYASVILNSSWVIRYEVAATASPN